MASAIPLDVAIAALPHLTGDFTSVLPLFPLRWLVMMGGEMATRWAMQDSAVSSRTYAWTAIYLVFGFTAAALLGGAMSHLPA